MTDTRPAEPLLLAVVIVVGLNLRPFLTGVGPIAAEVSADTGLGLQGMALLTLLPMLLMPESKGAIAMWRRVRAEYAALVSSWKERDPATMPAELRGLTAILRYVETGGDWPVIDSADPAYFYALRATSGPWRDTVNQLLAELSPHDVRALFILNKPVFYREFQSWDAAKQTYVADHLAREYQIDKQGTRAALFGPEPGMAEPGAPDRRAPAAPVSGPWGPARVQLDERAGPWGGAAWR